MFGFKGIYQTVIYIMYAKIAPIQNYNVAVQNVSFNTMETLYHRSIFEITDFGETIQK